MTAFDRTAADDAVSVALGAAAAEKGFFDPVGADDRPAAPLPPDAAAGMRPVPSGPCPVAPPQPMASEATGAPVEVDRTPGVGDPEGGTPSSPRPPLPFAPDWNALPPPDARLRAVVVIPAKDEALLLPRCLTALARQCTPDGGPVDPRTFEVLLLANNCGDDTAALARRFAAAHPGFALHVVEVRLRKKVAHVGHARRLLMDAACRRLRAARRAGKAGRAAAGPAGAGVVLSTDGDSRVADDWLAATLAEIDAGADAVGGRILCEAGSPADRCAAGPADRVLARWQRLDAIHRLLRSRLDDLLDPDPADPWPRHHQHFGASLAVTEAAYRKVGGLPAVRFLEDEALYRRLVRADLRVRHSPAVRVYTSCRQDGRVEVGLSWQLREWAQQCVAAAEAGMLVERPGEVVALARARRRLRGLWRQAGAAPAGVAPPRGAAVVARVLDVPADWLCEALGVAPTFGELWSAVEEQRAARHPMAQVPIGEAIGELKRLIARHSVSCEAVVRRRNDLPMPETAATATVGTTATASAPAPAPAPADGMVAMAAAAAAATVAATAKAAAAVAVAVEAGAA